MKGMTLLLPAEKSKAESLKELQFMKIGKSECRFTCHTLHLYDVGMKEAIKESKLSNLKEEQLKEQRKEMKEEHQKKLKEGRQHSYEERALGKLEKQKFEVDKMEEKHATK